MSSVSPRRVTIQGVASRNVRERRNIDSAASRPADPERAFRLRCWAKGKLYAEGEIDLIEAVDGLQAAAIATGVVDRIGQDAVQAILAEAFDECIHACQEPR
jgi:hypothetical protein